MKRSLTIRLIVGLVTVTILASMSFTEVEPAYRRKKLSDWADIYELDWQQSGWSANTPKCREAIAAVRSMRDKALPWILKLIQVEKPGWKRRIESAMEKREIRKWGPKWMWLPFYRDPADSAVISFQMLGEEAGPAVPELVQIIKKTRSPVVADRAIGALGCVGRAGLPSLMDFVMDQHGQHRRRAVYGIGNMYYRQPQAATNAIPLLLNCLEDRDREVSLAAISVLGDMAVESETTVPALANCLRKKGDAYLRMFAAESLQKFGTKARSAVPALVIALSDPDVGVRSSATNALHQIAPEVLEPQVQSRNVRL